MTSRFAPFINDELVIAATRQVQALSPDDPAVLAISGGVVAFENDEPRLRRELSEAVCHVITLVKPTYRQQRRRLAATIAKRVPAGRLVAALITVRLVARTLTEQADVC
jgi:hypothetical protein